MLPEHRPVRRGREMIDLLAVEEPKPKPAKIRAVSYEAAIDQLFKRMRSSCPFRKFHPTSIRIVRQNHRTIESDVCNPARARNVCSRSIQVAEPA